MTVPDISVITLNYNESQLTVNCILKLLNSEKVNIEIIVIDNHSELSHVERLREVKDKRVRLYEMKTNLGCSRGYNFGIKQAKGKFIYITNNDTEIRDKLGLYKMMKYLVNNEKVGVLQPKIKSLNNSQKFEYAGAAGGYMDILGYPFCRGRIFQSVEDDQKQYEKITDILWASTCAFFTSRSFYTKVGMFDEIYFAYTEEIDICIRSWNKKLKVQYFPGFEIFHRGEASWKKQKPIKTYYIHLNHLILFFKFLPLWLIVILLPARIILEFISMMYYSTIKSTYLIPSVIKAHLNLLFISRRIISCRLKNEKINLANVPLYYGSIVFDHYIKHINKFTGLNYEYT